MASMNTLILIGVVTAVSGLIAGILIMLVAQERRKSKPAPGAEDSRAQLFKEVARLWRDRSNGRLMVEVDGRMLAGPQTLRDAQRAELSEAAANWLTWLGLPPAQPGAATPVSVSAQPPAPAPVPAVIAAAGVKPAEPIRAATIVEQIDTILQQKLEGSALADKGIRLAEESEHGVMVWVGNQRYVGIESVPDAAIVKMIRAAVADWEDRNSAGRG